MPLKDWLSTKGKYTKINPATEKRAVPDGIWSKCAHCNEIIFQKELIRNLWVCSKCGHHYRISSPERIKSIIDEGTFIEHDINLISTDPLNFKANKPYLINLTEAQKKTGLSEAVITGLGKINGHEISLAVMDFNFIGGSMGSTVGEKIVRAIERAIEKDIPFVVIASSGGARMQEGIFSLLQMAKTSQAARRLHEAGLLFISVLTHPTTGGVLASFASLGDVLIAEPNALIGFTGPRVIEQTIRQKLPPDFQTAESNLKHGLIDMVVPRKDLKKVIKMTIEFFTKEDAAYG